MTTSAEYGTVSKFRNERKALIQLRNERMVKAYESDPHMTTYSLAERFDVSVSTAQLVINSAGVRPHYTKKRWNPPPGYDRISPVDPSKPRRAALVELARKYNENTISNS